MVPLLLIASFGVGAFLLYDGLTRSRVITTETHRLRWVEGWLHRAGLHDVTPRDFVLFSLLTAGISGLAAHLWLGWALVSLCVAVIGGVAPAVYYLRRHDRRRALLQDALVDAISQVRDGIRTGLSVQDALASLARTGPPALRAEAAILVREMRLLGFEPAMLRMRERVADPVFDIVASSLTLNDRLGGHHVSHVLDRLAHATREQLRIQHELRAVQSKNILAARIIAAVPFVVLLAIRKVDPSYLTVFNDVTGQLLLAGCVASIACGYAAMLWLTRLPGEQRIVR